MTRSERWLTILLRVVGTAAILAVVAVFMPRHWIARAHQALGFGPFPTGPVPEYLARCTSLFYVLAGVVHWWISLDVRRYGRAVVGLGVFMLTAAMVLLWIDIRADMPPWWTVVEGPVGVAMGAVYLILHFRSRVEVMQEGAAEEEGPSPSPADEAEPWPGPPPPDVPDTADAGLPGPGPDEAASGRDEEGAEPAG